MQLASHPAIDCVPVTSGTVRHIDKTVKEQTRRGDSYLFALDWSIATR